MYTEESLKTIRATTLHTMEKFFHEIAPFVALTQFPIEQVERTFLSLLKAYRKADEFLKDLDCIPEKEINMAKGYLTQLKANPASLSDIIESFIVFLQEPVDHPLFSRLCHAKQTLQTAFERICVKRSFVFKWEIDSDYDFLFRGNRRTIGLLIQFLIKMGFPLPEDNRNACVFTAVTEDRKHVNAIRLWSDGRQYTKDKAEVLFEGKVPDMPINEVLGYTFCKRYMETFKGNISCVVGGENEFEYQLTFPKLSKEEIEELKEYD